MRCLQKPWEPEAPVEKQAQRVRLCFHDCGYHFTSWFVMRGAHLEALQKILGHATLAMTMRYAHLSPEHLRSEIAKTEWRTAVLSPRSAQSAVAEERLEV